MFNTQFTVLHSRFLETHHLHVVVPLPLTEHVEVRWVDLQHAQTNTCQQGVCRFGARILLSLNSRSWHGGGVPGPSCSEYTAWDAPRRCSRRS